MDFANYSLAELMQLRVQLEAELRRREAPTCPHCGTLFEPRRKDQVYCRASCRTMAYAARMKADLHYLASRVENNVVAEKYQRLDKP